MNVAAYVDGEMSAADVEKFETHIASCAACTNELNAHKTFLHFLNDSLDDNSGPELPADFTHKIVTTVESGVSGLRDHREHRSALMILAALFVLAFTILLATGKLSVMLQAVGAVERLSALARAAGQLVYSIGLSFSVVLKAVTQDVPLGLSLLLFFSFGLAALFLLTLLLKTKREKNIQ